MHLFIDDKAILAKLSEKGNTLDRLDKLIDRSQFQPVLIAVFSNTSRNRDKYRRNALRASRKKPFRLSFLRF